jgi:hypothetical protein
MNRLALEYEQERSDAMSSIRQEMINGMPNESGTDMRRRFKRYLTELDEPDNKRARIAKRLNLTDLPSDVLGYALAKFLPSEDAVKLASASKTLFRDFQRRLVITDPIALNSAASRSLIPGRVTHVVINEAKDYALLDEHTHSIQINFNGPVGRLPASIRTIVAADHFNHPLVLPPLLTSLTVGFSFNQPLKLNDKLESLAVGYMFNRPLKLNDSLKSLTVGQMFNHPLNLNDALTSLVLGHNFNQLLVLNDALTTLTTGDYFNQPLVLNDALTTLTTGDDFNQPLALNDKLESLKLGWDFDQPLELNDALTSLNLSRKYENKLTRIKWNNPKLMVKYE